MNRLRTERLAGIWLSGGLESDALEARVCVETVTEGGRIFMVTSEEIIGRRS